MKKSIKKITFLFYGAVTLLASSFSYGQNKLTAEMIDKINTTEKQSIYSIAETVKFDKQVLRADEIVFAPESILELTNLNVEYIVIIADKIKFTAPLKKATIKRSSEVFADNGIEGTLGSNGSDGTTNGRHGTKGADGGAGSKGTKGETKKLPKIYIVTNMVTSQASEQAPDFINLKLLFSGIDGGNGGRGGSGGDGGNGGNGRKGSDGPFHCKSGPGDGGNGGNTGKGGQGGDAGDGGNGANIIFIGSQAALEVLSYSVIINTGGDTGIAGRPGANGSPGSGGTGGAGSSFCHGGSSGKKGNITDPANEGSGVNGKEGAKGTVEKFDISEFTGLIF